MKRYKQSETDKLADILRDDGVISVPTDTVYGICARINSKKAYNKLLTIKNRPSNKSFPVMCADIKQIKSIAIVDEKIEKIINNFMPGPITLVLNKKPEAFTYINNRGFKATTEMAVRMATSKAIEELINKTGSPIFVTSANISGKPTCNSLEEIENVFPTLDGIMEGNVSYGQASTIKIQRPGPIAIEQVMEVLKEGN